MKKRKFDYEVDFDRVDFRKNPELYQIGLGEQGVLSVQPYKSEILPNWRFKTVEIAKQSAETIYQQFVVYREAEDFVGMDMARKFLQMGFTRSRRYANHKSGIKRKAGQLLPQEQGSEQSEKAECARIFKAKLEIAEADALYLAAKTEHLIVEAATTARLVQEAQQ